MVVAKILALATALIVFFMLMVFGPLYGYYPAQIGLLILFLGINTWQKGLRDTRSVLSFCLPFILSLLIFGVVFDWFSLLGRQNWLFDSLIKAIVFPNSLLAVKITASCITYKDVLLFPLPSSIRRNLIITKAVMEKCGPMLSRHRFFMDTTPHFADLSPTRKKFYSICGAIMAAYMSIYAQTEKTQELFDHRTAFLRNKL